MAGSGNKINYNLRPAKQIERKMLCEAMRKLTPFSKLETYTYIGFGSFYFRDFYLLHKSLGIQNMISIESEITNIERFEFNKPFRCIKVIFGPSNSILPSLDWNLKTIAWLDYDGPLNTSVLTDINFVIQKLSPGSMFIVSVNAEPLKKTDTEKPIEIFKNLVGELKVPTDINDSSKFSGWETANIYYRVIKNEIQEHLSTRNGPRPTNNKFEFKQLFNFHYSDNAKMLTVGGVLIESGQSHTFDSCAFQDLPFVSLNEIPYLIELPLLTYREIRYLDSKLPNEQIEELKGNGIPEKELREYSKLYRYFPTFAESEM